VFIFIDPLNKNNDLILGEIHQDENGLLLKGKNGPMEQNVCVLFTV
jgi:hypothetical protein